MTNSEITIPETVAGFTVTSIGMYAFLNCPVSSITIPNSVITIEEGAFQACHDLKSITNCIVVDLSDRYKYKNQDPADHTKASKAYKKLFVVCNNMAQSKDKRHEDQKR